MRKGKWPGRSRTEEHYSISNISAKILHVLLRRGKYPLSFRSRDRMNEKEK